MSNDTVRTLTVDGLAPDPIMVGDTLWSHAVTLGRFLYAGKWVTIDRAKVQSFVRNFQTGYPSKVPIDYEHGSAVDSKGAPVRKGGDVVEMRGVFSVEDFTDDLKAAAEKIIAKNGRALTDPNNLGLWIRWRPTALALGMVKAGEYSEHSIHFTEEMTNPHTGAKQGPTMIAVALTNTPHVDLMNSIAASRDDSPPAAPAPSPRSTMPHVKLLATVAAVTRGQAPADEEQAEQMLSASLHDINRCRTFTQEVGAELGEADTTKAVDSVRKLKTRVIEFEEKAEKERLARIEETVKTVWKEHEAVLRPLSHPGSKFYADALRTELKAGTELSKTQTLAAIKDLRPHGLSGQTSLGDDGRPLPKAEDRLVQRTRELMNENEEVKGLARQYPGTNRAFDRAAEIAERELEEESQR